jgi:two-component system CheB/CheR fusion protein
MAEITNPNGTTQTDLRTESDRTAQPVDLEAPPRLPFPVIGVGASAGGLEAFIEFFSALPPKSGMAFVLIQHLPPDRESLIADILTKRTEMPVHQVEDGMPVEVDHVYVIRPGRTMTIKEGRLHLGDPLEKPGHRCPVDDFFRSLAEEQRERAVCVVMSGMGSNGTAGAQVIKAVGGVCIAQDPESAKFPSMPRNLIDSGLADFVLRPHDIPDVLRRYASHPYAQSRGSDSGLEGERQAFTEILSVIRTRSRQEFGGYKKPTVLRRIQRRMGLHQILTLGEYLRLLRQNSSEAASLADDLVIHVTGFFRDPDAWESLRERVIAPLVADPELPIRAWITACSSGEEAYTLAILLCEAAAATGKLLDIKIFATDLADRVLGHARNGVYPLGIESEISPERLERFFDKDDAFYRVKPALRELVVFAPQNILQDPPFSRLDICTCRNLLIYLDPEVQKRVLYLLHFALSQGGCLLLGNSETVSGADDLWETIDKKWRIFRRVGPTRHLDLDFPILPALGSNGGTERELGSSRPSSRASIAHMTQRALLDRFAPPAVVVDRQLRVIYFHGETSDYVTQPAGEPTRDLLSMARDGIRGALRLALHQAISENMTSNVHDGFLHVRETRIRIAITASRLEKTDGGYFLVSFEEYDEAPATALLHGSNNEMADKQQVVDELQRVRDELQSAVKELQSSNEELKASNEEVTSVNEELQSTNEELETSKEELQSLNEELTTVNSQLQTKMDELEATSNDLSSLLSSTDIAVVFLDIRLRIRRYTPPVLDLFELIPTDVGRPLSDLARKFEDTELMQSVQKVLDKLIPLEKEVISHSSRWYMRRILPYRTKDNHIDGVVITFVDITRLRLTELAKREVEEQYGLLVQNVKEYVITFFDTDGIITVWNSGAVRILGFSESEAIGRHFSFIFTPEDRKVGLADELLEQARLHGQVCNERWYTRRDGSKLWGSGTLTALRDAASNLRGFAKVMRDNTDRKLAEENLQIARQEAESANEAKDFFLATVSHELRTPLSTILLWAQMINRKMLNEFEIKDAVESIEQNAKSQKQLIDDLLDTSRISSGKLRLTLRETDLASVLTTALDSLQPTAKLKPITITQNCDPDVGIVWADPDRLQQVIWNLLSNAVKFTPAGGKAFISMVRDGTDVEIRVADNGDGIPKEVLNRLFGRFFQVEEPKTRTHGGLGLGLAICKQLVELHAGTITAESPNEHGGATFVVQLPLPKLHPSASNSASGSQEIACRRLDHVSILLVEDDHDIRNSLTVLLNNAGAQVTPTADSKAALKAFEQSPPQIILSDIGLPEMDGNALIRQIRALETSRQLDMVPAIALSAFVQPADRKAALDNGFQRFIAKPVDPDELLTALVTLRQKTDPSIHRKSTTVD